MNTNITFAKPDIIFDDIETPEVKSRFRLFYWGIPGPSTGKSYTKEVAEAIVNEINTQGMMVAPSPRLNIHLVAGLASNAEILGNVVYADISLLERGQASIDKEWEDGNYRCTVVLKSTETDSDEIDIEDILEISHVYLYSI